MLMSGQMRLCDYHSYVQGAEVMGDSRVQPTQCQRGQVCVGMRKEETCKTLASTGRQKDERIHFVPRKWKGLFSSEKTGQEKT